MITPDEDEIIPTGENLENDAEDQESQKEYHSDGVERAGGNGGYIDETQAINAADKASEAAYTLHLDQDKPKKKE